ncbi:MAG: M48 family metalloprotease [Actinobacteria bacterium]|nr:M48 family metalloprotease [Actinomycetota bacterium]
MGHKSMSRYAPDHGLNVRIGATAGLLASVFLAIVIALIWVGLAWWFVLACAVSAVLVQSLLADRLVVSVTGAQVVSAEEAPELHAYMDRLCALANMPKPRIAIEHSDLPNAFAAGVTPNRSLVCFTTGLLNQLSAEEFEAVAAHELAHIAHRDVIVMTVASTASVISGLLMKISAVSAAGTFVVAGAAQPRRKSKDDKEGDLLAVLFMISVAVLLVSSVTYAVNVVMLRTLSRYRELAADRGAVFLTGQPQALANALTRITTGINAIPAEDLRVARSMDVLSFAPAAAPNSRWAWLLSTHPTLQQRLDNIAKAAAQLGQPGP